MPLSLLLSQEVVFDGDLESSEETEATVSYLRGHSQERQQHISSSLSSPSLVRHLYHANSDASISTHEKMLMGTGASICILLFFIYVYKTRQLHLRMEVVRNYRREEQRQRDERDEFRTIPEYEEYKYEREPKDPINRLAFVRTHMKTKRYNYPSKSNNTICTTPSSSCHSDQVMCSICLQDYNPCEMIGYSTNQKCKHQFHKHCITLWLISNQNCPLCRHQFFGPLLKQEYRQDEEQQQQQRIPSSLLVMDNNNTSITSPEVESSSTTSTDTSSESLSSVLAMEVDTITLQDENADGEQEDNDEEESCSSFVSAIESILEGE